LLESAHEACWAQELGKRDSELPDKLGLPVIYDGQGIDLGYRIDLIVQGTVIVEIKCVESINPVHQAQLLSCIRRSGRNQAG
jgi:GxxExxY protein